MYQQSLNEMIQKWEVRHLQDNKKGRQEGTDIKIQPVNDQLLKREDLQVERVLLDIIYKKNPGYPLIVKDFPWLSVNRPYLLSVYDN